MSSIGEKDKQGLREIRILLAQADTMIYRAIAQLYESMREVDKTIDELKRENDKLRSDLEHETMKSDAAYIAINKITQETQKEDATTVEIVTAIEDILRKLTTYV